jgi:hypothetical protein
MIIIAAGVAVAVPKRWPFERKAPGRFEPRLPPVLPQLFLASLDLLNDEGVEHGNLQAGTRPSQALSLVADLARGLDQPEPL